MFTRDLQLYGPEAQLPKPIELAEAENYCRQLARGHYENFTVASWLLPRALHRHFYNIYAYCRWSDDLADELGDSQKSLELLDWWQGLLDACYAGNAWHPVFVALSGTIREFNIPQKPFADLLVAFRQDQTKTRYDNMDELERYCQNSANPVGHLVLYLGRTFTPRHAALADKVCTGLQLANFWQDIASDWDRRRLYIPCDAMQLYGYTDAMCAARECNEKFRRMMQDLVEQAEAYLQQGLALVALVPKELQLDVALFAEGGLAILQAIRAQNYDVWLRRPTVGKLAKLGLVARSWWQLHRGRYNGYIT